MRIRLILKHVQRGLHFFYTFSAGLLTEYRVFVATNTFIENCKK